jgi:hypothetical protein
MMVVEFVAIVACVLLAYACERGSLLRVATGIWIAFCIGAVVGRLGGMLA